jgi:hypothetical protein
MWITCVIFSQVPTNGVNLNTNKRLALDNTLPPAQTDSWCTNENYEGVQETCTLNAPPEETTIEQRKSQKSKDSVNHGTKRKRASATYSEAAVAPKTTTTVSPSAPSKQLRSSERNRGKRARLERSSSITKYAEFESEETPAAPIPTPTPSPSTNVLPNFTPYITQWNPNTTYLMCSSVSQLTPPEHLVNSNHYGSTSDENNSSPLISFFIPPDCMGSPASQQDFSNEQSSAPQGQVLQVTCQVVGMDFVPYQPY